MTSFDKSQGTATDTITISGYGFSTTKCNNEVTFGDATCSVTSATDSSLQCSIDPSNSPAVGLMQDINVRVNNRGNAIIAISGQASRTFVLVPVVTDISPQSSSVNGGLVLTISGSGYQGNTSSVFVTVNGLDCPVQSVSYTEVTCLTPTSNGGIKAVEVKVRANGNLIPAVCDVVCQVVYEPSITPAVTSINPTTINGTSATTITIDGSGFSDQTANTDVKIGGEICTVTSVQDNEIQCTITNVPVGTQDVTVVILDKGKATNSIQVTSSAFITSVLPSTGSTHGGTELTITGNGFVDGSTSVSVDGTSCDLVDVTLSQIRCTTKSHVAGSVDVVVTSSGQTYSSESFEYSAGSTPSITGVTPAMGTEGTSITIAGSNFGATNPDNTVSIGSSSSCTVTSSSATQIVCTVGAGSIGSENVVVDVSGKGLSNTNQQFQFDLTVSAINKNTGKI